jgi:hypothetical protein
VIFINLLIRRRVAPTVEVDLHSSLSTSLENISLLADAAVVV